MKYLLIELNKRLKHVSQQAGNKKRQQRFAKNVEQTDNDNKKTYRYQQPDNSVKGKWF